MRQIVTTEAEGQNMDLWIFIINNPINYLSALYEQYLHSETVQKFTDSSTDAGWVYTHKVQTGNMWSQSYTIKLHSHLE